MPSAINRDARTLTPTAFMSRLEEQIDQLSMLSKAVNAGAVRDRYPPVNALVGALKDAQVIPDELAEKLLDAIPLLSRAIAGKSEFNEAASDWLVLHGEEVLAELKETYRRTVAE